MLEPTLNNIPLDVFRIICQCLDMRRIATLICVDKALRGIIFHNLDNIFDEIGKRDSDEPKQYLFHSISSFDRGSYYRNRFILVNKTLKYITNYGRYEDVIISDTEKFLQNISKINPSECHLFYLSNKQVNDVITLNGGYTPPKEKNLKLAIVCNQKNYIYEHKKDIPCFYYDDFEFSMCIAIQRESLELLNLLLEGLSENVGANKVGLTILNSMPSVLGSAVRNRDLRYMSMILNAGNPPAYTFATDCRCEYAIYSSNYEALIKLLRLGFKFIRCNDDSYYRVKNWVHNKRYSSPILMYSEELPKTREKNVLYLLKTNQDTIQAYPFFDTNEFRTINGKFNQRLPTFPKNKGEVIQILDTISPHLAHEIKILCNYTSLSPRLRGIVELMLSQYELKEGSQSLWTGVKTFFTPNTPRVESPQDYKAQLRVSDILFHIVVTGIYSTKKLDELSSVERSALLDNTSPLTRIYQLLFLEIQKLREKEDQVAKQALQENTNFEQLQLTPKVMQ